MGSAKEAKKSAKRGQKKFEFLDLSTADIAVAVYGKTLSEVFENAALAMFEVMINTKQVKPAKEKKVKVRAHDLKSLMFNWLNEVLYVSTTSGMLFSKFRVGIDERTMVLKATCWGEKLDQKRHDMRTEVKSCTYHLMDIRKTDNIWRAQVIFDI